LNMDVVDVTGDHHRGFVHSLVKIRLDPSLRPIPDQDWKTELKNELGRMIEQNHPGYCGSCYGGIMPESGCCNTCDAVKEAYAARGWAFGNPDSIDQCVKEGWKEKIQEQAHEGCNLAGFVNINKVIGNIQFSPGRSFVLNKPDVYELVPYLKNSNHYFGHFIHDFSFEVPGRKWLVDRLPQKTKDDYSLDNNPLTNSYSHTDNADYMFQYFLRIVSTRYKPLNGEMVVSHQYSATSFERDLKDGELYKNGDGTWMSHDRMGIPGAFFNFDISPMQVLHVETQQSFAHFVTSMAVIIGGVLTIASVIDAVFFTGSKVLKQGAEAVAAEKKSGLYVMPGSPMKMM
jgi:hypothetical protein